MRFIETLSIIITLSYYNDLVLSKTNQQNLLSTLTLKHNKKRHQSILSSLTRQQYNLILWSNKSAYIKSLVTQLSTEHLSLFLDFQDYYWLISLYLLNITKETNESYYVYLELKRAVRVIVYNMNTVKIQWKEENDEEIKEDISKWNFFNSSIVKIVKLLSSTAMIFFDFKTRVNAFSRRIKLLDEIIFLLCMHTITETLCSIYWSLDFT